MRPKILKALAVISFGLVTFPFLLTNDVLAFENISVVRILCYYGVCAVVFIAGYAFGNVIKKHKKLIFSERITGILTFFTGLLLLFITKEVNIIFALGVSAVLWYFLGERASHKHYADIFPMFMFGVYIGVTLLCYLFFRGMCEQEFKEPVSSAVICAFMVELCLAALLINQSGIYDKANRRRETRTMLPKGLSGYNAALVLGITVIGLCFYLFSDGIVWFLNQVITMFINIILFLLSGNSDFVTTVDDPEYDGTGYVDMQQGTFLEVIFIIVLIVLAVIFRKKIFAAIKDFIKRIYSLFTRETDISEPEPDFTDIFEKIASSRRRKGVYTGYSELMKLYKNEKKDPVRKFRYGYGVLLMQLIYCKADIHRGDTVSVHYEKGRNICGAGLKEITDGYDRLRYNDSGVTDEQLSCLDSLITEMNTLVRGIK